jgi:hypothetical protein
MTYRAGIVGAGGVAGMGVLGTSRSRGVSPTRKAV